MSSNRDVKKIVCIPAFKDSKSISDIFQKSIKYVSEVIVYDGTKDDTYEIAMSAGSTDIRNQKKRAWCCNEVLVPCNKTKRWVYNDSLF